MAEARGDCNREKQAGARIFTLPHLAAASICARPNMRGLRLAARIFCP